jgi:outer membrane protein assembly factor BamE (lipoprotein component of BamABCDE complex)
MYFITQRPTMPAVVRSALGLCLLAGVCSAYAASGFTVTPEQEKLVSVGMSRDEVRNALGRPAHNVKYMAEPGRTWTWGVITSENIGSRQTRVFDVDFDTDQKVRTMGERIETDLK